MLSKLLTLGLLAATTTTAAAAAAADTDTDAKLSKHYNRYIDLPAYNDTRIARTPKPRAFRPYNCQTDATLAPAASAGSAAADTLRGSGAPGSFTGKPGDAATLVIKYIGRCTVVYPRTEGEEATGARVSFCAPPGSTYGVEVPVRSLVAGVGGLGDQCGAQGEVANVGGTARLDTSSERNQYFDGGEWEKYAKMNGYTYVLVDRTDMADY